MNSGISRLELNTPFCSVCELGVPQIYFSQELDYIIIDLGDKIELLNTNLNRTSSLCKTLLSTEIIMKIGNEKSICFIDNGKI